MNTMAWQRYFEPIVLIVLAWLGTLVWRRRRTLRLRRRLIWSARLALAALLLGLSTLLLVVPMVRHATA